MSINRSMPDAPVIPVLYYADVAAAVAWLRDVLGFAERLRIGTHRVQLTYGGGAMVAADGGPAPAERWGGHSVMIRVHDVDAIFARAESAGATVIQPPTSFPYGERQCTIIDPGGHAWTLSQSIADSDPADWGGELVAG